MLILLLLATAACIALYLSVRAMTDRKIQKNADQILDKTFSGSELATYKHWGARGLSLDQVLAGADKRGYTLLERHQDTKKFSTLVFKKSV